MSTPHKRGFNTEAFVIWGIIALILVAGIIFYSGYAVGAALTGQSVTVWNPVAAMIGVIRGTAPWSMASTVVSIVVAVLLLGGAVGLWWRKLANSTPSTRVDKAGSMMGSGADIAFMREKAALNDARLSLIHISLTQALPHTG